ncbi:MAG TPA: class I SAM-dependent methyltransferase [Terriglobales bacterium]|nr:class I SAM-dependent methyltransferase [Terriglobales bacterium]
METRKDSTAEVPLQDRCWEFDPNEREAWNRRYSQHPSMSFEPDPFLLEAYEQFVHPLHPKAGAALDIAGGMGRHAIWLAELRWNVSVVDISEVAFERAQKKADERGVNIDFLVRDLNTWSPDRKRYDLVLVFYYLQRDLFAALEAALKPGGLLIYASYTGEQLNYPTGPRNPLHLLKQNELLHAFPNLRTLFYRETIQEKAVAELVALKPK